jgi:pyruvate dehydrogenase E2 component (dihydrolipoamide acetyltransferase)
MASEITVPRLGWNMEEGTFIGWLKSDGEHVAAGEPLFSLEGDKATQDVESLEAGILRIPPDGPSDGDKIAVGTLIGYLVAPGEPAPFAVDSARTRAVDDVTVSREGEAPSEPESAMDSAQPSRPLTRSNPARTEPRPPAAKPRISPRARRVASELGVDAVGLRGSGNNGRVVERDIRAAARTTSRPARATSPGQETVPSPDSREIFITPMRRTIADRMVQSAQATAGVTLATTVDATNLVNLRHQFKAVAASGAGDASSIGITDIIVKLSALALEQHPLLNSRWNGDTIVVSTAINIGVAVDTDHGLLVPVMHDVSSLTLRQLAARSRELFDRARRGTLRAAEMHEGTFTVTNLGPMGIDLFTPLINLPECAILGLGRIQKQVVVDGNQFVARDRMALSLTFDHRIVDGAPAARFLQSLSLLIENPSPWLLP